MTCAVSAAVREGAQAVICASTGNTAASAAAYAARGGLRGAVIVPDGKIATGKLAQALVHGARVISMRGNFDTALELVRELADAPPDRARQLRQRVPPRGPEDGGVRAARGPRRASSTRSVSRSATPATSPPTGRASSRRRRAADVRLPGCRGGAAGDGQAVEEPETIASAIRIGNPARWEQAINAMSASRGAIRAVTDEEILSAYRCSPRARACSASRRRRRRSRACSYGTATRGGSSAC